MSDQEENILDTQSEPVQPDTIQLESTLPTDQDKACPEHPYYDVFETPWP